MSRDIADRLPPEAGAASPCGALREPNEPNEPLLELGAVEGALAVLLRWDENPLL